MRIKTSVRLILERIIGKFGYTMVKNLELDKYRLLIDENVTLFCEKDFKNRDTKQYTVSWIMPPPGKGSGGHMTLFRTIRILSDLGLRHKIYICDGGAGDPTVDWRGAVREFYGIDLGENEIYPNISDMTYSDAIVATSWYTAYVARNFNNCVSKFYFVQDFEPFFFARGSEYFFAENTYRFGFRGITAGNWLAEKLHDEYGMETQPFFFAYDRNIHITRKKEDNRNRIFCYARPNTERRAFEMAVLALEALARRVPDVEVVFAGQKLEGYHFAFDYRDLGILRIEELSKVYSQCDMCLVLSMTNLSLLPMEVMASGSVVVSNQGENNSWLLNDQNAILVDTDPLSMAKTIEYYLKHKEELEKRRAEGLAYVKQFTWETEIEKVYRFMVKSIEFDVEKIKDRKNLKAKE